MAEETKTLAEKIESTAGDLVLSTISMAGAVLRTGISPAAAVRLIQNRGATTSGAIGSNLYLVICAFLVFTFPNLIYRLKGASSEDKIFGEIFGGFSVDTIMLHVLPVLVGVYLLSAAFGRAYIKNDIAQKHDRNVYTVFIYSAGYAMLTFAIASTIIMRIAPDLDNENIGVSGTLIAIYFFFLTVAVLIVAWIDEFLEPNRTKKIVDALVKAGGFVLIIWTVSVLFAASNWKSSREISQERLILEQAFVTYENGKSVLILIFFNDSDRTAFFEPGNIKIRGFRNGFVRDIEGDWELSAQIAKSILTPPKTTNAVVLKSTLSEPAILIGDDSALGIFGFRFGYSPSRKNKEISLNNSELLVPLTYVQDTETRTRIFKAIKADQKKNAIENERRDVLARIRNRAGEWAATWEEVSTLDRPGKDGCMSGKIIITDMSDVSFLDKHGTVFATGNLKVIDLTIPSFTGIKEVFDMRFPNGTAFKAYGNPEQTDERFSGIHVPDDRSIRGWSFKALKLSDTEKGSGKTIGDTCPLSFLTNAENGSHFSLR